MPPFTCNVTIWMVSISSLFHVFYVVSTNSAKYPSQVLNDTYISLSYIDSCTLF
ncbi:hypothetical protein M378DRAFT_156559 [Amanita muscaria Koide BX008]|uniref:Uncharacterized protein n=1 Tax=Amanita muscaria (strain Koide BX008) TaxID=946122 RepID=A0A0C2XMR3_AMAMK|nr:hypothetical protein M378DRAFT_156559 [Amanita muscaria Koide BX008]